MPVESGVDGIEDLNPAWPTGTDPKSEGDDHIRNCKAAVQGSFPSMSGPNNIGAKLTANGLDANGGKVENVASGAVDSDAANIGNLNARVPGYISWGVVGQDGNSGATPGSGDFTSARIGLGHYRLTFTNPAIGNTENQSIVCTVSQADQGKHNRSITTYTVSANTIDVFVYNTVLADKVDDDFHFQRMCWI